MKAKTIKKILAHKVESLASFVEEFTTPMEVRPGSRPHYDYEKLPDLIRQNTIVTGGCITSMLLKENPNDYDFYFRTREAAMAVTKFFMWLFQQQNGTQVEHFIWYREAGDDLLDKPEDSMREEGLLCSNGWRRHIPDRLNGRTTPGRGRFKICIKSAGIASTQEPDQEYRYFENFPDELGVEYVDAVTRTDEVNAAELEAETNIKGKHHPKFMSANAITLAGKIQLVTRFWGEVGEIHGNYDFVHCTCSYQSWDKTLTLPQEALEAILTKELRYVGSLYPLCSIIRIRKFVARGWQINAGQILKMCMQLNDLNLRDLETLKDQLTGVDAAYFMQIIARLSEKQQEKILKLMDEESLSRSEAEARAGDIDSSYLMTIIDRIF